MWSCGPLWFRSCECGHVTSLWVIMRLVPKNQGYKTGSGVFFGGMSKEADEVKQTFGDWCCQLCLACNLFIAVIHIVNWPWLHCSEVQISPWSMDPIILTGFLDCVASVPSKLYELNILYCVICDIYAVLYNILKKCTGFTVLNVQTKELVIENVVCLFVTIIK